MNSGESDVMDDEDDDDLLYLSRVIFLGCSNRTVGENGPDFGARWLNWECLECGSIVCESPVPFESHQDAITTLKKFAYYVKVDTEGLPQKITLCREHPQAPSSLTIMSTPFSSAHRLYVKSLYRRMLKNELDWVVRRDIWRGRAMMIRAEFERNRSVLVLKLVGTLV